MKLKKMISKVMAAAMVFSAMSMGTMVHAEETVELTFMGWEASPLETKAVEDGIAAFEAEYPNIKVTYTPGLAGAEYNAKILTSAAAGALPDVMFVAASEEYGTYHCTNNGTCSWFDFACAVVDAAGVPYPSSDPAECWTIDEFREVAKSLTTEDVYGIYGLETVQDTLNAQLLSNGGARYNEDFTESIINSPESKEVFETIKAIRVEDGSAPDATTLDAVGMSAAQMLETGKVAMLCDGSWALQELAASGMNIGMAPLPSYGEVLTTGQAHLHCISSTTAHPEEAWQFLQFLSGMDYQGALCKSGLWMPNRYSMYEGEQLEGWYDESVHGDSYRPMLDYFMNAKVDPAALQKSAQARDILMEESDMYFKMDQDIDTTLANIDSRINAAIKDAMAE